MTTQIVIDATNATLGRLSSFIAKQALLGKKVIVVNCSDTIVTGRRSTTISEYQKTRARGGSSLKGPNFPKESFRIVKRTVRGMLSYKQKRGKDALKRVICYNDTPEKLKEAKKITAGRPLKARAIKLSELSDLI